MPALAYAVAYPGGVFGIIASVILLGKLFRVKEEAELEAFENERRSQIVPLHRRSSGNHECESRWPSGRADSRRAWRGDRRLEAQVIQQ